MQCQKDSGAWSRDVPGKGGNVRNEWTVFQYMHFPFWHWQKKMPTFNVHKSNTNTSIWTSKCCHREITGRVIHPRLHPCLQASLLLKASSFFLCSLYFFPDRGACFIVFCHVSIIAPTACLMLSMSFFCCCSFFFLSQSTLCAHLCGYAHVSPQQGWPWVCGAEPSRRQAPHGVKWQPPGSHWLMTVKTLAVNVRRGTNCHSQTLHLWAALTTVQCRSLWQQLPRICRGQNKKERTQLKPFVTILRKKAAASLKRRTSGGGQLCECEISTQERTPDCYKRHPRSDKIKD